MKQALRSLLLDRERLTKALGDCRGGRANHLSELERAHFEQSLKTRIDGINRQISEIQDANGV